jgi:hypothetical protein
MGYGVEDMRRRAFLSLAGVAVVSGCTGDDDNRESTGTSTASGANTPPDSPTDSAAENTTSTEVGSDFDAIIMYSDHIQNSADGEYNLPEPRNEDWGGLYWIFLSQRESWTWQTFGSTPSSKRRSGC